MKNQKKDVWAINDIVSEHGPKVDNWTFKGYPLRELHPNELRAILVFQAELMDQAKRHTRAALATLRGLEKARRRRKPDANDIG